MEKKFNWSRYLSGLGTAVLVIGIAASVIFAFTIISVPVPGYYYVTEFSLSGLLITLSTLAGSFILHAIFYWFSEMLRVTEEIRKKLIEK